MQWSGLHFHKTWSLKITQDPWIICKVNLLEMKYFRFKVSIFFFMEILLVPHFSGIPTQHLWCVPWDTEFAWFVWNAVMLTVVGARIMVINGSWQTLMFLIRQHANKGLVLGPYTDDKALLRLLRTAGRRVCSMPEFPCLTLKPALHWIIQHGRTLCCFWPRPCR